MKMEIKNTKIFTLKTAAVVLMILAASDLQAQYYQFIKTGAFFLFALLAYVEYSEGFVVNALISGAAAILFFPLNRVHLHRSEWQMIDIILAILVAVSIIFDFYLAKKSQ